MSCTLRAISKAVLLATVLSSLVKAQITIGAAISFSDVLPDLCADFENRTRIKAVLTFAASNMIARQIESGAPIDVFISADQATTQTLRDKNLIRFTSTAPIATNQLVVIVPKNSKLQIKHPRDLLRLSKLALAEPTSVPAGVYAKAWLKQEKLWADMEQRIIPLANVRSALQSIETANADAAIVYLTDAQSSSKVHIAFQIPARPAHSPAYYAAIPAATEHPEVAGLFITYLSTPSAREILNEHSFQAISD